jgi:hypothetical protein
VNGGTGRLLLETLQFATPDAASLRARWAEPQVVRRGAAMAAWARWEGAALWLHRRLSDLGILPQLSAALREALQRAAHLAAQAHLAIDAETERVVAALRDAAVESILIKGSARRVLARPPLSDTRRTSDVDVLIPVAAAERAWRALRAAAYAPIPGPPGTPPPRGDMWGASRHHLWPLARPGGAAVELHVSTSWELAPEDAWRRLSASATSHQWRGLALRCPAPTELLWHALTHAEIHDPAGWRLRFWLDAATALALGPVEWSLIEPRLGTPELPHRDAGRRWLQAASTLAGIVLPAALESRDRYPLQRIVQWRLALQATPLLGRALREKLVDESTRAEMGAGLAPPAPGRALSLQLRHRAATVAARLGYIVWRAAQSTD